MAESLFAGLDDPFMGALFSEDRVYRYRLWRHWSEGPTMAVIGLNPSTADETQDDPTIRRCIGFAKREGCGRLEMLNLFGLRSTDPTQLSLVEFDPIGPDNDDTIMAIAGAADVVVAAWGAEKYAVARARDVTAMLAAAQVPVRCLGRTASGAPRHPLYLHRDTELVPL